MAINEVLTVTEIRASVVVPVPDDMVLIAKSELEQYKKESLKGTWWTMKDLEKQVGRKREWIKDNILYPPEFKKILDVKNGGFVYYPENQGQAWVFQATKMAEFLEEYFGEIFTNNRRYSRIG